MARAAAIFDMDGVLTDSHALHEEAWQRLCKEEGLKLGDRAIWRLTSGRRTHDALPLVFERSLSPEDLARLTARHRSTTGSRFLSRSTAGCRSMCR